MTIIEQIKAEIDKRYAEYNEKKKTDDFTYYEGMADALDLFEQFIDTLESEKPMQEGLEEEIDRLWESFADEMEGPHNLFDIYVRLARHFAQWGAEHFRDLTKKMGDSSEIPKDLAIAAESFAFGSLDEVVLYGCTLSGRRACFIAGAKWDRQQMMKIITKDDNLEEAGKRYVETYFRDIDWTTPDVIKSCLEEAFISGGEYVFKQIKYE